VIARSPMITTDRSILSPANVWFHRTYSCIEKKTPIFS
jgi:hypothetical protein